MNVHILNNLQAQQIRNEKKKQLIEQIKRLKMNGIKFKSKRNISKKNNLYW
jgi:predicted transposase YdaD